MIKIVGGKFKLSKTQRNTIKNELECVMFNLTNIKIK